MSSAPKRLPLAGVNLRDLERLLDSRTRALAVLRWLHLTDLSAPPAISARHFCRLLERCELPSAEVAHRSVAADGTTKYLIALGAARVEAVHIPFERRSTVCLSSQAGCSRRCRFCATASLGLMRNLRADEIVEQFLIASRGAAPSAPPVRNVVFMGMGEPMDNLDEVLAAIELLTQPPVPQLRSERVTVSTSGVLPGIERFLRLSKASLALSLNASTDEQRAELIPHAARWPIAELMAALRADRARDPGRAHFIEYVLFEDVNDSEEDARRVARLLEGVNARVNVIPHNPFPGNPYRAPAPARVLAFQKTIAAAGYTCVVRSPRGRDISAACGQLSRQTSAAA